MSYLSVLLFQVQDLLNGDDIAVLMVDAMIKAVIEIRIVSKRFVSFAYSVYVIQWFSRNSLLFIALLFFSLNGLKQRFIFLLAFSKPAVDPHGRFLYLFSNSPLVHHF